jgi:hypothetical protein
LKWQYTITDEVILARQFSVKWWDKYNFTKVQERLYSEFSGQTSQATPVALPQAAPAAPIQPKSRKQQALKAPDQALQAPRKSSPSASSSKDQQSSSSKSKKKTSSEKKTSKQDILAIVQALLDQNSNEDDDGSSSDSSVHLDNIKDSFQDPLGAQDPYESESD